MSIQKKYRLKWINIICVSKLLGNIGGFIPQTIYLHPQVPVGMWRCSSWTDLFWTDLFWEIVWAPNFRTRSYQTVLKATCAKLVQFTLLQTNMTIGTSPCSIPIYIFEWWIFRCHVSFRGIYSFSVRASILVRVSATCLSFFHQVNHETHHPPPPKKELGLTHHLFQKPFLLQ